MMKLSRFFNKKVTKKNIRKRYQTYQLRKKNYFSQKIDNDMNQLVSQYQETEKNIDHLKEKITNYRDQNKKTILVLGAGSSANYAIKYFLEHAKNEKWIVRVGDVDEAVARAKVGDHPYGVGFKIDVNNIEHRRNEIAHANIVVSTLPTLYQYVIAKDCVELKKKIFYRRDILRAIRERWKLKLKKKELLC